MVEDATINDPDFDCKNEIADLKERLGKLEGAFYQFQFTLEGSERWSRYIYRFTLALIFLAIVGVAGVILNMYRQQNNPGVSLKSAAIAPTKSSGSSSNLPVQKP